MYFSRNHFDLVTRTKKITLKQNDLYFLLSYSIQPLATMMFQPQSVFWSRVILVDG